MFKELVERLKEPFGKPSEPVARVNEVAQKLNELPDRFKKLFRRSNLPANAPPSPTGPTEWGSGRPKGVSSPFSPAGEKVARRRRVGRGGSFSYLFFFRLLRAADLALRVSADPD